MAEVTMCKKGCSLCRVWPGVFNGHFSMSCDRYHLPPYDYYYYYNASGAGGWGESKGLFVLIGIYYLIS